MDKITEPPETIKVYLQGHGDCEFEPIVNGYSLLVNPVDGVFPIAYSLGENLIISTTHLSAVFNTDHITEHNIEQLWYEHNKSMTAELKGNNYVN